MEIPLCFFFLPNANVVTGPGLLIPSLTVSPVFTPAAEALSFSSLVTASFTSFCFSMATKECVL